MLKKNSNTRIAESKGDNMSKWSVVMKSLFITCIMAAGGFMHAQYYVLDNFANANNWKINQKYNFEKGVWTTAYSTANGRTATWTVTAGKNTLNTWVQNEQYYTTSFYGIYSLFTNQFYSASPENPFGVEITRWRMRNDNGLQPWLAGVYDIGLIQNNPDVINNTYGAKFDYSTLITELDWQDKSPTTHWNWRQKSFTNSKLLLTALTNNAGLVQNIQSLMEWNYETAENANAIRFRFEHDGEYVYFYINPNPYGANPSYSNSFFLVDRILVPASFTNDLSLVYGFAHLNDNRSFTGYGTRINTGEMTNFTIRSIAHHVTSELSPATLLAGGSNHIHGVISPDFSTYSANYAGIAELYIDLPAGYNNWANYTNRLGMFWITNGSVYTNFGKEAGDRNPANGNVSLSIINGGTRLKVRFDAFGAANHVFHPDNLTGLTTPAIMFVISNFVTLPVADSVGKSFTVYAGNEKYADTDWSKWATTGKMKSRVGNAYDMTILSLVDEDLFKIRTVNDPVGIGAIRPSQIYEGDAATFYYDISLANATNNNANVTRVEIAVPSGFSIDAGSLESDRLSSNYVYLTNRGTTNLIVADYFAAGTRLVAGSGLDTITFRNTSTPSLSGTNLTVRTWKSYSWSSVSGTGVAVNTTNAIYPSQKLNIRKKPPAGEAYVTPGLALNTEVSNSFSYVVKNNGQAGNLIEKVLLRMDPVFTNVSGVSTLLPSVRSTISSNGYLWVRVDYKSAGAALTNANLSTISLRLKQDVLPITNVVISGSIQAYADNGNGEGYKLLNESVNKWSIRYYTPPAEVRGLIKSPVEEGGVDNPLTYFHHLYTDLTSTTNVTFTVKNWGKKYNDIYEVELHAPLDISSIVSVNSVNGVARLTNFGATNAVVVSYTNSGLLTAGLNSTLGEEDTITMFLQDNVTAPKNVSFKVMARNTTNKALGANLGSDNLTLHYLYPPAYATGHVEVPGGFIDAATNEYTIHYYIKNTGRTANKINAARIKMPAQFTNSTFVSNTFGGVVDDSGTDIVVNYSGVGGLPGGQTDRLTFIIYDNIGAGEYLLTMQSDVSNDRWYTNNIGVTSGQSQSIQITPPPTLYSYGTSPQVMYNGNSEVNTNTLLLVVTNRGWGSNLLDKVRITVPAPLAGKVLGVSNVSTGLTDTVGGNVKLSNSGAYIWIEYDKAGQQLDAGKSDSNYIRLLLNDPAPYSLQWLVWAANNSTNTDGSHNLTNTGALLAGGTNRLVLVDKAYGHISSPSPAEIFTPTTFNTLTYFVKNGDENTGYGIKKLRIALSNNVFSGVNNITTAAGSSVTNYTEGENTWVEVSYSGSGLGPKSSDNISFVAFDTNITQEIFVRLPFEADYGDGGGWRGNTGVSTGQTNGVQFRRPSVSGLSYVTPVSVPKAYPSQSYEFYVKNNGITGSDILRVKIAAPDFVTHISGVSSDSTASNVITTNAQGYSNVVVLYYTNSLESGQDDSVTLTGFDAVNSETNGTWSVLVNNDYGSGGETAAIVPSGQSLGLAVVTPPTDAKIRIQATNYVSSTQRNTIYSTAETSYLKFEVFNFSGGGDFLTLARIRIPGIGTVYDTNGMTVQSLLKSDAVWSLSNDYIIIDYNDTNWIGAGFKDEILIGIADDVNRTNLSVVWSGDAAFNTTFNQYQTATLYTGGSLTISYVMPSALASVGMSPTVVYLDRDEFLLNYPVVNSGSGANELDRLFITLPVELRSGFDTSRVSNSMASDMSYSGGVLTLSYTNFTAGSTDNIWLRLSNTTSVSGSISVTSKVRNYVNTNNVSGNQTLFMATVPSYYLTPNSVSTATRDNTFQVFVNNDSTGSSKIQKVVLVFPGEIDSINSVQSEFFLPAATNIVETVSSVTLYYSPGNYIGDLTNKDVITLSLRDNVDIGNFTNNITGYVDDGMGLIALNLKSGKSRAVVFSMPAPVARSTIDPSYVYLGTVTNSLSLTLTNQGTGTSALSYARITLPAGLSNAHNISSSWGGTVSYEPASNRIQIDYTGGLLVTNRSDTIDFDVLNLYGSSTNVGIAVTVANLTNGAVYVPAPGPQGDQLLMNISYPPVAVEGFFPGDYRLYLIETNATLTYRVLNRSFGKILTKAELTFGTNWTDVFEQVRVQSTIPNTVITSNSNSFTLEYDPAHPDALGYTLFDDVRITFKYKLTNTFGFGISGEAWLTNETFTGLGTNITMQGATGYKTGILVTNSTWGIAYGEVFPVIRGVNIKVYYPDTTTTATNISGESVASSTSAGNGDFILTRLPAGPYDVEFSGTGYRKTTVSIIIPANLLTNLSVITMRNGLLTSDPNVGSQLVFDYGNTNTWIQFPAGAIDEEFSIDIGKSYFSQPQKDAVDEQSDLIAAAANKNVLYGYRFTLRDVNDSEVEGAGIEMDAVLQLVYEVSNLTVNGWNEADLAIYYWDENQAGGRWVRVGGSVDSTAKTVTAKVSYVHRFYAVMARGAAEEGSIQNVTLRPKVFTPGMGDSEYYQSVRLSFEFDQEYESYEVSIYDLKGNRVKYFSRSGGYTQGEVSWDGLDDDGQAVKSGVYVYRVVIPGTAARYSGTVIIAR